MKDESRTKRVFGEVVDACVDDRIRNFEEDAANSDNEALKAVNEGIFMSEIVMAHATQSM